MKLLAPLGLFGLALVVRLLAMQVVTFPVAEASAYYTGVAVNLVTGVGLVSDSVWSFATPPLVVPKPAFELWLPMGSFLSAGVMVLAGPTYEAAQLGGAVVGATVAPLAWAIGSEAAIAQGLDARRRRSVALTSGLLAALVSPLVLGSVVPDSYIPFTVFMLAAALLTPRALGAHSRAPDRRSRMTLAGVGLGLTLGLAYLSRQEVIWMGLTVLLFTAWAARRQPAGSRVLEAVHRLWPVILGGLLVVGPWLIRNWLELGSPFPGQAIDNMFLLRNEDIFAFSDHPDASTYMAQGPATILGNPLRAGLDGLVNVIAIPAFPVGIAGLAAAVGMWRAPALRQPTALTALLLSGLLIFLSTILLFPVATLWGTFMHSSGPLLVALGTVASLGGDALLARVSHWRRWGRPNIVIAPVALIALTTLFTTFQVRLVGSQASDVAETMAALGRSLVAARADAGDGAPDTVITDHPMWLADATGTYAVALPDEDISSLITLGKVFSTRWVVVTGKRGRYPDALLEPVARSCLAADPISLEAGQAEAWLFQLADECPAS